jgi:hypothetical protein
LKGREGGCQTGPKVVLFVRTHFVHTLYTHSMDLGPMHVGPIPNAWVSPIVSVCTRCVVQISFSLHFVHTHI